MKTILKGNRQLTIQDEQLSDYLEKGYSEVDESGEVITKGKPTDMKSLEKDYKKLEKKCSAYLEKIEELQEENKALVGKIEELQESGANKE